LLHKQPVHTCLDISSGKRLKAGKFLSCILGPKLNIDNRYLRPLILLFAPNLCDASSRLSDFSLSHGPISTRFVLIYMEIPLIEPVLAGVSVLAPVLVAL